MLENNKGHHSQIKKVGKFMKDEMHVALNWRGNLNREPQLKTGGGPDCDRVWAAFPPGKTLQISSSQRIK